MAKNFSVKELSAVKELKDISFQYVSVMKSIEKKMNEIGDNIQISQQNDVEFEKYLKAILTRIEVIEKRLSISTPIIKEEK